MTSTADEHADREKISTHTLTWSVTEWFIGILDKSKDFNSHAHVERDFHHKSCPLRKLLISTHTLTWSVTICITFKISAQAISTHTLTWSVTVSSSQVL